MVERPVNAEHPGTGIPLRPMGSIPVLARLVDAAGTERWIPARANRWTRTHVLVTWLEDPAKTGQESSCWLTARDVTRQLSGPSDTLAPGGPDSLGAADPPPALGAAACVEVPIAV